MRLIDADALKDEMRAGCVPIDLGGITGITGDDDSIEDYIDAAPTIDAIPVEWLREKIKEHTDEEGWQDYLANSFGLFAQKLGLQPKEG